MLTNNEIASLYERDLRRFIDEINAFNSEDNLWKTFGSINNSSGNLALHIIGGLNHFVGATLANTGYVRNRDLEFTTKGVDRKLMVQQLEELIPLVNQVLNQLTPEQMASPFPIFFDIEDATHAYLFTQLLLHMNYHLGQVNYLRRALEP